MSNFQAFLGVQNNFIYITPSEKTKRSKKFEIAINTKIKNKY